MTKKLVLKRPTPAPKVEERPDHLGPTERKWMAHKQKDQMFAVLDTMSEGNNAAFDILMLAFEQGADDLFHKFATALDDMNIRGEQIVIGYQFAERDFNLFRDIVLNSEHGKRRAMLIHINQTWKKGFMEAAVQSGAHKWMHKKIVTAPPIRG